LKAGPEIRGLLGDTNGWLPRNPLRHRRHPGHLDIVPVWVTQEMVDGQAFTTTGHALGDRTLIGSFC
jgi:hypothetical protein